MMYGDHMGTGGWVLSILVTLVVVALLAAAVVWLAQNCVATRRSDVTE
jgi:hypothetical protein